MVCTIFTSYQKWAFSSAKSNLASIWVLLFADADGGNGSVIVMVLLLLLFPSIRFDPIL